MEVDENTNIGYIYVTAPTVPKTLLFSGLGITAIDLAFDQNMNPFVAYKQLGLWKFWWWDPTILSMVHTPLPDDRDLRCCLDDHHDFAVAFSDIVLAYVNASDELCVRYQRDRYSIEYVLASGIVENLVYVERNAESRVQFGFGYLNG